ncbi:MAG: hypothetical protein NC826_05505 [Candidatus Omnitrophica bacterium]|nr:hypothetical protein [Candidatus Omnitrophota bacterium]
MKKILLLILIFFLSECLIFSEELKEILKKEGLEFGIQLSPSKQILEEEREKYFEAEILQYIFLESPAYRVACNSNFCAFAQKEGKISIYDLKNKKIIYQENISRYPLYNVAFHPFKNIICCADREGKITIFDLDKKEKLHTIYELGKRLSEVKFSPDGKYLAVAYLDSGQINVYNLSKYQNISTIKAHTEGIYYLAFSPEGRLIASASRDRKIGITPIDHAWPSQLLTEHLFFVLTLDFSPDNEFFASGGGDGKLIVWKKNQNVIDKNIYFEWIHPNWVTTVKFFRDYIITSCRDGKIRIFDFMNKKLLGIFKCSESIFSIDITPQSEFLFVSTLKGVAQYNLKEIIEKTLNY